MTVYAPPGTEGSKVTVEPRYGHFIGGNWVEPKKGEYFENISPVTGRAFTEVGRGTVEDIEAALDAAHAAAPAWGKTSLGERSLILNRIADRIEENLEALAIAETWDNGKPVRETLAADLPLTVDHFRYFAGVLRGQEGSSSEIDSDTVAYHFHEPLGVVAQIIPWNFPILMATWKLAPALAAGNAVVLKPAEQTPWSILKLLELIGDLHPGRRPQRRQRVRRGGRQAARVLAAGRQGGLHRRDDDRPADHAVRLQNIIPVTLELGGKSPNVFFDDVAAESDAFYDKALEGFSMFALNQGEVCTCPSRALVQQSIYSDFVRRRHRARGEDHPGQPARRRPRWSARRPATTSSRRSCPTSTSAVRRAPRSSPAASATSSTATSPRATTSPRPSSRATTRCGSSRRRSSGRSSRSPASPTRPQALEIANDTLYGLGAGVWTRDGSRAYRMGRGIKAGRVWTNCYHAVPGARRVRRLQAVRHRAREPQDDARPLPADEEPARLLLTRRPRLLLDR